MRGNIWNPGNGIPEKDKEKFVVLKFYPKILNKGRELF